MAKRSQPIVHLSTVHPRVDTRILFRNLRSLVDRGARQATLVVADGQGSATVDAAGVPVEVRDIGRPGRGRVRRFLVGSVRAVREVRRLRPVLLHFHDPELIPAAIVLKLLGTRVIYDVHEDVPRALLDKFWRGLVSCVLPIRRR